MTHLSGRQTFVCLCCTADLFMLSATVKHVTDKENVKLQT